MYYTTTRIKNGLYKFDSIKQWNGKEKYLKDLKYDFIICEVLGNNSIYYIIPRDALIKNNVFHQKGFTLAPLYYPDIHWSKQYLNNFDLLREPFIPTDASTEFDVIPKKSMNKELKNEEFESNDEELENDDSESLDDIEGLDSENENDIEDFEDEEFESTPQTLQIPEINQNPIINTNNSPIQELTTQLQSLKIQSLNPSISIPTQIKLTLNLQN